MKIILFVAREIQYFELGIFNIYYLTRGFIALTCGFNLLTRAFNLATGAIPNLATRAYSLLTLGFELVTRRFARVLLFHYISFVS